MLSNLIDRLKLPFRKDRELISSLYDILGFYPHKVGYYKLALMHKSLGHRSTAEDLDIVTSGKKKGKFRKDKNAKEERKFLGRKLNNERLEFLGDAILDAVVGDIVYQHFPGKPEGFLTNTRSKLVKRETLGKLAHEIGLSRLILSSGRSASHNSYMAGNAFEALVGAIYLDRGYATCMEFMQERILGRHINIDKMAYKEMNFKSKLIEWTQKNRIQLTFRLEDQSQDKNGSPIFKYTAVLETVDGATGTGFSKKESQQHACEATLQRLRKESSFLNSVFAAKTQRTSMDEDMVQVVPNTEQPADDFIIVNDIPEGNEAQSPAPQTVEQKIDSEMTLDDISNKELTKDDIIAAAEAEAYK